MSDSDSIRAETKAALVAMTEEAKEMQEAVGGSVTDAVAGWLAPRYAQAAREQLEGFEGPERLKLLRTFAQDWALLRKGDHSAARLRQEEEWLELERGKSEERMRKRFEEWARRPEVRETLVPRKESERQRRRILQIIDHFMLGAPLPPEDEEQEEPRDPAAMI